MKNVCVVCGGKSHEHEISLISAYSVLKNIDTEKFNVSTLIIDKDGNFFYTKTVSEMKEGKWKAFSDLCPAVIPQGNFGGLLVLENGSYKKIPVDVFFPVLHGENGEDGVIQGVFKMSGVAYVGSDTLASATCMDKELTHIRLDSNGIKTAPYIVARQGDALDLLDEKILDKLGYPVFVKPANAGSSVGVSKAKNVCELESSLKTAFEVDSKVLIEKNIVGAEVECAVLGNENPVTADFIGEICPTVEFYDFDAKYTDSSTSLFIPARVSEASTKEVLETAILAYKAMGCEGLSRVDFFVLEDGSILLNEINNLPGFTSISMYPKLFEASGVSYSELITRLIQTARLK